MCSNLRGIIKVHRVRLWLNSHSDKNGKNHKKETLIKRKNNAIMIFYVQVESVCMCVIALILQHQRRNVHHSMAKIWRQVCNCMYGFFGVSLILCWNLFWLLFKFATATTLILPHIRNNVSWLSWMFPFSTTM